MRYSKRHRFAQIWWAYTEMPKHTYGTIAKRLGISKDRAKTLMDELCEHGLITYQVSDTRYGKMKVFTASSVFSLEYQLQYDEIADERYLERVNFSTEQ